MKRITRGLVSLSAVAFLAAQSNEETPRYVAVELNLDGAVRDAGGVSGRSGQVSRRSDPRRGNGSCGQGEHHASSLVSKRHGAAHRRAPGAGHQ